MQVPKSTSAVPKNTLQAREAVPPVESGQVPNDAKVDVKEAEPQAKLVVALRFAVHDAVTTVEAVKQFCVKSNDPMVTLPLNVEAALTVGAHETVTTLEALRQFCEMLKAPNDALPLNVEAALNVEAQETVKASAVPLKHVCVN